MLGSLLLLPLAALAVAKPAQNPLHSSTAAVESTTTLSQSESKQLLDLHRNLVEFQSITENEHDIAQWLAKYLRSLDFTVELQPVFDSKTRYNVLAYGSKRETSILVTSHIDTVPPYWPYYYNETSAIIGGRGSVDAKGSVAPQIIAVQGLREQLFDDMSLLFVVGEETGGDGMRAFSAWDKRPNYDIVVFGEPTEGKLVCGHKGILSFSVKVKGKAAHSGYPWLGVSANDVLVEALGELVKLREKLPRSEKYGNTTMNFGRVEGGVANNVVAETASAGIAVRLAAGTPKHIRKLVTDALSSVTKDVAKQGGELSIEWLSEGYGPVNIDCDIEGFEQLTVNYGTDVPNLVMGNEGEYKKYLYGPGSILVAHSDHEAIKRKDLEQAVLDYRRLIVAAGKMHAEEKKGEWENVEL